MAEIAFLLTRPPHASPGARSFFLLARAALDAGHKVRAFFYFDGVYQVLKGQQPPAEGEESPSQWLENLVNGGARLVASNRCMRTRGLEPTTMLAGVRLGTMEELSALASEADRVVCL